MFDKHATEKLAATEDTVDTEEQARFTRNSSSAFSVSSVVESLS
jgi:hypothetical protein